MSSYYCAEEKEGLRNYRLRVLKPRLVMIATHLWIFPLAALVARRGYGGLKQSSQLPRLKALPFDCCLFVNDLSMKN